MIDFSPDNCLSSGININTRTARKALIMKQATWSIKMLPKSETLGLEQNFNGKKNILITNLLNKIKSQSNQLKRSWCARKWRKKKKIIFVQTLLIFHDKYFKFRFLTKQFLIRHTSLKTGKKLMEKKNSVTVTNLLKCRQVVNCGPWSWLQLVIYIGWVVYSRRVSCHMLNMQKWASEFHDCYFLFNLFNNPNNFFALASSY